MIKNIIFDIGKVLVDYEPNKVSEYLGFDEKTMAEINKAMFGNELWKEFDRSALSDEKLLTAFIANNPKYENEIKLAFENVGEAIEVFNYADSWLCELKERGYKLYVLSNYAKKTYEKTYEKLKFLHFFDGKVFSFDCKYIKPEEDIYQELLNRYGLEAGECVFIDDRPENIDAAEKIGIKGIVFDSYDNASKELDKLLK